LKSRNNETVRRLDRRRPFDRRQRVDIDERGTSRHKGEPEFEQCEAERARRRAALRSELTHERTLNLIARHKHAAGKGHVSLVVLVLQPRVFVIT